jgi:hypothetical protein
MQSREGLTNRSNARLYIEAGYGQDTNANMGTYNDTLNSPGLTGLQIDTSSKAQFSNFAWIAAGSRWVRQVSAPFAVFAGLDADNKLNTETPQFDTANVAAYAGFSMVSGSILYRLSVSDAITYVSNSRYSGRLSANGELQYAVGDGMTLSSRLQHAEQSYNPVNSIRDSTMETLGLGVEKSLTSAWRPVFGLQLSESKEDNLARSLDLSRVMDTWRISVGMSPGEKSGLLLAYSEQQATYQGKDRVFDSIRFDTSSTLDLIWSYAVDHNWTLRADVQQMENKSNQSIYAFRRTVGGVKMRYNF